MRSCLALLVGLLGCDAPAPPDGGAADAGVIAITVTPPAPAALPVLTPCPSGWREASLHGVTVCEPWTADAAPTCAATERAVPGRGCVEVAPCPTGEWPDDAPLDALYVAMGGTGTGTREAPLGEVGAAMGVAAVEGRVVVIGEGVFEIASRVAGVPEVRGLCPARTRLVTAPDAPAAGLRVVLGSFVLRGVHVSGPGIPIEIDPGASATLEGVVVEGTNGAVQVGIDGTLEVRDSRLVSGGRAPSIIGLPRAVLTVVGSELRGAEVAIQGAREPGDPTDPTLLSIEGSSILDTQVALLGALSGTVRASAIERVASAGLFPSGASVRIEDSRLRAAHHGTAGVVAVLDASAQLVRVTLSDFICDNALTSLADGGTPPLIAIEDVVVDGGRGTVGYVGTGAEMRWARVLVGGLEGTGMFAGGRATITDLRMVSPRAVAAGLGHGVVATDLGAVTVERAALEVLSGALLADGTGTLTATDVAVRGGGGIAAQCTTATCDGESIALRATRLSLAHLDRGGVAAVRRQVWLEEVSVDDVVAPADFAFGLGATSGGRIEGSDVSLHAVAGVGAFAIESGTLSLTGLEIVDTFGVGCEGCTEVLLGDGIACHTGGVLALHGFVSRGSHRAGLAITSDCGAPTFENGTLVSNGIGVLVDGPVEDPSSYEGLTLVGNAVDVLPGELSLTPADFGLD